jgi:hypothetical protein
MAGDWIKMRVDLADDPAVIRMAAALDISEDEVVGKLHRLWSWADRQTADGTAPGITVRWVDRYVGREGFAVAMELVGWLDVWADQVAFPDFEKHNGRTAKARAEAMTRQRESRGRHGSGVTKAERPSRPGHDSVTDVSQVSCDENVTTVTVPSRGRHAAVTNPSRPPCDENVTREEKRREEKNTPGPRTHAGACEDLDQMRGGGEARKRKPKTAASSTIRTAVTIEAIAEQARAIFDACHYSGPDGGNLWGVAALLETDIGELSEAEVYSACRGAELNGRDKPSHFFACLAEAVARRGLELTQLLRRVNIVPEWPTTKDGRRIEKREKVRA